MALATAIAAVVGGCHWPPSLGTGSTPSPAPVLETAATAIAPDPNQWITVAAPDRSYAIAFPQSPAWRTVPWIEAKYEDGERFYFVRSDLPQRSLPAAAPDRVRAYLEAAMPGVALLFGGSRIDYSEPIQLDRYPGQRLMFENASGIQFEARLFFDPQTLRLFVVAFGTTARNLAVPEAERFFNSFQILDDAPRNGPQAPNGPR
ncbi:MAG: hypothetical protein MH825_09500 [Cyanobacteria bacterium]|nr:hypothetical protein [Cyanobacteriota bacterium]